MPTEQVENRRYQFTEDDMEVYKQKLQTALRFAREHLTNSQNKQKQYYDANSKVVEYKTGNYVLLRSPPVGPYTRKI